MKEIKIITIIKISDKDYSLISQYKNKWIAQITLNGKNKNLGVYLTAQKAALVRDNYAKKIYGEFAKLNFI